MILLVLIYSLYPSIVLPFSITQTTASIGDNIGRPAFSGQDAPDIEVMCRMELNPGDHWTSCTWSHVFTDVWGLTNSPGYIMCTVSNLNDNQQKCDDVGNLQRQYGGYDPQNMWVTDYVDRLSHIVTDTTCGLKISKPHANDTGSWKCEVNDNSFGSQSSKFWSEVNLYVANRSEVIISDPVEETGKDRSIWVDISTGRARVQASCKSVYGIPLPKLVWYIDEQTNRVSSRDATITTSTSSSGTNGDFITSTISMDISEKSLSSFGVRPDKGYFSFTLGCYPDQENYFSKTGTYVKNPAEVMVFGKSTGVVFGSSLVSLLLVLVTSYLYR